jgi:hypothetical protein
MIESLMERLLNDKLQLKQGGKRPWPNLNYYSSVKPVNSCIQSGRIHLSNVTFVTNFLKKNPSWEANSSSAKQEILSHFVKPEGSLLQ